MIPYKIKLSTAYVLPLIKQCIANLKLAYKTSAHLRWVDADGHSHAVSLLALDALDVDHPLLTVDLPTRV